MNTLFDVKQALFSLDPESDKNLDFADAIKWFKEDRGKTFADYSPLPPRDDDGTKKALAALVECRNDVFRAYEIANELRVAIKADGLENSLYQIDLPLTALLSHMEFVGMCIDRERSRALQNKVEARIKDIETEIQELIPANMRNRLLNLKSSDQVADLLFNKLQLSRKFAKTTEKGKTSVDSECLEAMQDLHPAVPLMLEYRKLAKAGPIVASLLEFSRPVSGLLPHTTVLPRVHPQLMSCTTRTGRLSCINPNVQQVPKDPTIGTFHMRDLFVASSDDHVLFSADHKNCEIRILAHLCKDPQLLAVFNEMKKEQQDVYKIMASKCNPTRRPRR